ncbi:sulfonate ABC transporter substrate-binding protein [Planobispora rosea]|uniref:Sulfonate ABC transporter substrate-binding protein n=1 Tax=Planobispora rosea TaxID=35762 RepID=A0A8J3WHD8_PLARO|nr:ABC transporter substrate-binding protein [Planobispora rosea]GGS89306.1 sulfonate ABC transporter substrate-binding protein [Planobispora rosea]GIH87751.1 sulfonate ABC transporter substrate-binding protein [Planobispora rosea]
MRNGRAVRHSLIGLVTVLALASCGGSETAAAPSNAKGLEKTELNIGVVPVPSSAPLFIAQEKGFFKEEGLTIKTETIQAPQAVMPKILNGSIDAFLTSYVSLITISDSGAAKLKMLAESQQGAPGINAVMVVKDSPLKEPKDLKGKKIAVNVVKALGEVTISAQLKVHGLTPADVKFVPVPFAEQLAQLKAGTVDAAWLVEPYISAAQKDLGARVLIDTLSGQTEGLPLDGWAATDEWISKYPKTAAAFQRAINKAQQIAATDRQELNKVIPGFTQIPAEVASSMAMGTFSTSLNPSRVQRVADLLSEFQIIKNKVDATTLLASAPQ